MFRKDFMTIFAGVLRLLPAYADTALPENKEVMI